MTKKCAPTGVRFRVLASGFSSLTFSDLHLTLTQAVQAVGCSRAKCKINKSAERKKICCPLKRICRCKPAESS